MKYIAIETQAIDEVVSDRFLQSTEFPQGERFVRILIGSVSNSEYTISPRLKIDTVDDIGLIITFRGNRSPTSKWLVIDTDQCGLTRDTNPTDLLFVFQKLCRFCKKIWANLSLTFAEQLIKGSSKAVLFPFKQYQPVPYRIVMEREPWKERLTRRGQKGNFLLAYKSGYVSGNAAKEEPELTNFRKAFEALSEYRPDRADMAGDEVQPPLEIKQLQVASLADNLHTGTSYRTLNDWLTLLTAQQQRFVKAEIVGPHRIEGAAGTGKTLCLMLKAVLALRAARDAGYQRHIVFVTHSDATRSAIADVIAVIDQDGFFSADRDQDLQSLRICTLSELCSELLRQSISETELIDRDAMESKALQLLYIEESLSRAIKNDLSSHLKFLSPSFAEFIQDEDTKTLVDMLQHEISVIIKGRASEDLNTYRKVPRLKYGLPTENDSDKGFVFIIFRYYQVSREEVWSAPVGVGFPAI